MNIIDDLLHFFILAAWFLGAVTLRSKYDLYKKYFCKLINLLAEEYLKYKLK